MGKNSQIALETSSHAASSPGGDVDVVSEAIPESATAERFVRSTSILLFLLGILLLGVGAIALFRGPQYIQKGGPLLVDAPVKSFGDAPPRTRVSVTFELTNQSRQAITILGATPVCGREGCVYVEKLPLQIPPLGARDLVASVETKEPGEFVGEFTIFSDGPAQPKFALTVSGRVGLASDGSPAVGRGVKGEERR
jgi:hypothetical protein